MGLREELCPRRGSSNTAVQVTGQDLRTAAGLYVVFYVPVPEFFLECEFNSSALLETFVSAWGHLDERAWRELKQAT